MQRIFTVMDAHHFNARLLDFAGYIARISKSGITGLFVQGHTDSNGNTVCDIPTHEQCQALFTDGCSSRDIEGIPHATCLSFSEIEKKTRFADLLIIDPTFSIESPGNRYFRDTQDLLAKAECPVILAPSADEQIDEIIFAYDDSKSSMHAIKQFTYLLPFPEHTTLTLLHIQPQPENNTIAEHAEIREWLQHHYQKIQYKVLHGKPEDELFRFLLEKSNIMLVIGAFGRNNISSFLKPSTANMILRTIDIPIFVAHV